MLKGIARFVSATGLAAIGGLHAAWAAGAHWPAKNEKELARAVVGDKEAPGPTATAVVAAGATAASAVAAGALGEGRCAVALRRTLGIAFLVRAFAGGDAALAVIGRPQGGKRFQELDRDYYRPWSAVLGVALLVGARRRRDEV